MFGKLICKIKWKVEKFSSRAWQQLQHRNTCIAISHCKKSENWWQKMMCAPAGRITATYGPYHCTSCAGNRDLHTYFVCSSHLCILSYMHVPYEWYFRLIFFRSRLFGMHFVVIRQFSL
jgi:hypothetical protein